MKLTLLALLLALAATPRLFSQNIWIRPHAVWHYGYTDPALSSGFIKIRYTADTLIGDHDFEILEGTRYRFQMTGPNPEDVVMDSSSYGRWFTYAEGNTVFYYKNDQLYVLYNFSMTTGDTWTIETGSSWFGCDDTSSVRVTDFGSATIQNEAMRYMDLEANDSSSLGINARVLSRIGTVGNDFLFPTPRNCDPNTIADFTIYNFLCYEDDSISYNPAGGYCEWFLGIEEKQALKISVSPNPVRDLLSVTVADAGNRYQVVSLAGQPVTSGILQFSEGTINVATLASGVYFLCITDQQGLQGIKRFVKE